MEENYIIMMGNQISHNHLQIQKKKRRILNKHEPFIHRIQKKICNFHV